MLLNCHTYFSLGYGTLSPERLIKSAKDFAYQELILTDINNTSAVLDSLRLSKEFNVDLKIGIDFRNGIQQKYIGIAKNNKGFQELNKHLSEHLHLKKDFLNQAPDFQDCFLIYPLKSYADWSLGKNEFIGISLQEVASIPFTKARKLIDKSVILHTTTFSRKRDFNAHRLLRAIDKNILLSQLKKSDQAEYADTYISKAELQEKFNSYPQIIENTQFIIDNSKIEFEMGKMSFKNKRFYTISYEEDNKLLREKCEKGIPFRYGQNSREIQERLDKELQIIEQMKFASYYLINWDIINYAQSKNYFYVGRGSGANSMAAYLLRITDVDPIDLDLYFERFINPFRNNPPDFDIDFSWTDRDDMTRYIFERFGYEYTALLGTYTTYQKDAVTRELGKVFGLPGPEIERLQKNRKLEDADSIGKLVLQFSQLIAGFPSHLSIHASGILISERPIQEYTATFLPPKGYPTTQFSMIEAEDIGFGKFDILSQRGLGKIKDAVEIILENQGVQMDIHQMDTIKNDPKVKELLKQGKCIGCFYIESPAMRMLLTKLKADDYLRLVAASSIIRPGVSKSGMMNEYIERYRNKSKRDKAQKEIPALYDLLKETYGVMVYQEDVIKVAHYFADLSLAEADYLRRGMSWKFKQRNEFHKVRKKFFDNCIAKGYSSKTITDIWNQIESFANYAFSKAHSASYAVESFQALYLKAYYPLEYMVAVLNNGGGFYRREFYVHEARMHGAEIVPPCINKSDVITKIEGKTIYLGFQMIEGIDADTVRIILSERKEQDYQDLIDFIERTRISLEQTIILIRVGAFNFFNKNKKELLWKAHLHINPKQKKATNELFKVEHMDYKIPKLEHSWLDDAFDEIELLGFPLCSPFKLLKERPQTKLLAKDLKNHVNKKIEIIGYLTTVKPTRTSNKQRMNFGTFIDQEGEWIDTVHFPPSAKAFPFRGKGCYLIKGKVTLEYDFTYIDVSELVRLATIVNE